jgi:acyl dehydratase
MTDTTQPARDTAEPICYFDDIAADQPLPPVVVMITQDGIDRFGMASLDLNPVHMNPDWSTRAQVFGRPETVQHGMMSMSLMTSVVLRRFGPLAQINSIDSKFTKPVPVGTTVTYSGAIRDLHPIGRDRDFVTARVVAHDQDGDLIGTSDVEVRLPRRP